MFFDREGEPAMLDRTDRNVVTISRQMGSLGRDIAIATADLLGYRVVWRELINEAAHRIGKPEVALAQIDELGLLGFHPTKEEDREYREAVREVMEKLSAEGNVVILGRAGYVMLQDHPNVFHVRIIAPAALRVQRIAEIHGIKPRAARSQVRDSDAYRRSYIRRMYGASWSDPSLFDLVLNSARITPQTAARMIREALMSPLPHRETSIESGSSKRKNR